MYEIDDEAYNLVFKDNSGNRITIEEKIIDELNHYKLISFPEGTAILDDIREPTYYKLEFPDKSLLKIFNAPTVCKFIGYDRTIKIYSYEHLKLILKKLEYKRPIYFSKFYNKSVFIDADKIQETKFDKDRNIEIREKEDDYEIIKKIYDNLKSTYIESKINFTYDFLNPNYNDYYSLSNMKLINLTKKFKYIRTNTRDYILNKIQDFIMSSDSQNEITMQENNNELILKENDPYLLPVCGPHGTGKTITSLFIHKYLFSIGIKGIYLNLKYYSNDNIKLKDKIKVLIKECFFIVENENELYKLYNQFIKLNDIYDIIPIIKNFIENKKDKNKFYIIMDQYQHKYNFKEILRLITNIKIFLLSSINDKDVKLNLVQKYKEEFGFKLEKIVQDNIKNPRDIIRYNYIENLIDSSYFKDDIFRNIFIDKISQYEKEEEKKNDEIKRVYYILEKFNFIPKYVFEYINYYDYQILDLLFNEYSNIIQKLNLFTDLGTINVNELSKLFEHDPLNKKVYFSNNKTFTKKTFVEFLDYIPLKYISYNKNKNGEYYFKCIFPLFKTILKKFIDYKRAKNIVLLSKDGQLKGINFEYLLKIKLGCFKRLKIDGYLKVNRLIHMDLTKKYKNINQQYFKLKNNILIDQKINEGKDYDFGIYQPKKYSLILIQSKYIINNNTLKHDRTYYKNTAKKALKAFNNNTKEDAKKVYILFMSSVEFNYKNRDNVINKLENYKINCIFYSIIYDIFTLDFYNYIDEIQCNDSFMIIPNIKSYEPQKALDNQNFEIKTKLEEEKCNKDIILLKKRNMKSFSLKEMRNQIIQYIKKSKLINEDIIKHLGSFKEMNRYLEIEEFEIDKITEYVLIFYLDDSGKFNNEKNLGLIYYDDKYKYCLDFKEKQNYEDYNLLIDNFAENFYYAIGTKTNIKK